MKRVAMRRCVARCGWRGADGAELERYEYDPAGNVLAKTVGGRRTAYAYDAANQLVSATAPDGVVTEFGYDAAGRMVREGARTYRYGWLDKVLSVSDGASSLSYEYHADGQLARASVSSANGATSSEGFLWDGLALVRRGSVSYVNGPHPGGGEVLASSDGAAHFNDVLGTTLGVRSSDGYVPTPHTAFGDVPPAGAAGTPRPAVTASSAANSAASSPAASPSAFFTGKPRVAGLGHAFLFRNYRADLSRWPTLDPIGYPDGWNGFAYCRGMPMDAVDWLGGLTFQVYDMHFGDDVVPVKSASELFVSQCDGSGEGGAFTYGTVLSAYDRVNGRLSVSMSVGISISAIAKANSMFGVGAVAEYRNHGALANDAYFANSIVYEAVLVHEMAHANSFFSYEKLRILSDLYELEGRLQSSSFSDGEILVLVCDVIRGVIDSNEARYNSNMSANNASRAWFDDRRNGWTRFYDSSGLSKWRKEE